MTIVGLRSIFGKVQVAGDSSCLGGELSVESKMFEWALAFIVRYSWSAMSAFSLIYCKFAGMSPPACWSSSA